MEFNLEHSLQILDRTPTVLRELLSGLDEQWIMNNEGPDTWSPYDVLGHLVHGEQTDWTLRLNIMMSDAEDKRFQPFDRFAQFENSKGKSMEQLLDEFEVARERNMKLLRSFNIQKRDLQRTGIHPKFGTVTLRQLLSTWTAHDLAHILQISRVMANLYKEEVGPWAEYLSVMK
jgi:hypothetical protein